MKERPILFSGSMVRALLNCTKSQTRRVVKPQPLVHWVVPGEVACPYGQPGDRLWVRESGWERPERTAKMMREGADTWPRFAYAADDWNEQDRADFKSWGFKTRPSIHMPRWASRILLEITSVRVERLADISEADVLAEGLVTQEGRGGHTVFQLPEWGDNASLRNASAAQAYRALWSSINGPSSWNANPWVWVVEFKRVMT